MTILGRRKHAEAKRNTMVSLFSFPMTILNENGDDTDEKQQEDVSLLSLSDHAAEEVEREQQQQQQRDDTAGRRTSEEEQQGVSSIETAAPSSSVTATVASSPPRRTTSSNSLPLSMTLLKYTPGTYCSCCGNNNNSNHGSPKSSSSWLHRPPDSPDHQQEEEGSNILYDDSNDLVLHDYDLQSLRRQNSAASPLVVAPMMMPNLTTSTVASTQHTVIVERIISEYISACQLYGCAHRINAGVLTTLRFALPCLRVSGSFHDADMLALGEVLLKYVNGPLRYIKRLDFSIAGKVGKLQGAGKGFRSHGAFCLSKVLQQSDYIEEVFLQRNRIGPYGACAVFIACSTNSCIRKLLMRRCRVGERGALCFAEFIAPSSECGLVEVDLSSNFIGLQGSIAIERSLATRAANADLHTITADLEGNLVFQEIMNGVTHGLGVVLAFVGSFLLARRARRNLTTQGDVASCMVYSCSLIVLYISSTLFHSFVTMQHTKYIFEVCDKCAIYILIAGSYTPFLTVILGNEPIYSVYLLTFIWVCCFLGICVEAFFPEWPQKGKFSLAMYLGMGWSAVVCLPEVARVLPESATNLMILGGVGYTAGVPFFVRNNNLDHAIWHLFVLAGSFFHWCGIYFYVAQQPWKQDASTTMLSYDRGGDFIDINDSIE